MFDSSFLCSLICETNILNKPNKHAQRKLSLRSVHNTHTLSLSQTQTTNSNCIQNTIFFVSSRKETSTQQSEKQLIYVKQTRIDEQYNLTVSSRISIWTNPVLYPGLSSPNFDSSRFVSNQRFIPTLLYATSEQK